MEHTIAGLGLNLSFFNIKCSVDVRLICGEKRIFVRVNLSVSAVEATAESRVKIDEPICKESPSLKLRLDDAVRSAGYDTPEVMRPKYLSPTKSSMAKELPRLRKPWLKARSAEKACSARLNLRENRRSEALYYKLVFRYTETISFLTTRTVGFLFVVSFLKSVSASNSCSAGRLYHSELPFCGSPLSSS